MNKEKRAIQKERKRRIRQYVWDYLSNNPCIDCGEKNPILLEFDHRKSFKKISTVSNLVSNGYSIKTIVKEIGKCRVRCVKCHRMKTAKDQKWYKDIKK